MPDQPSRRRAIVAGQLALELPGTLPALALEPEWKLQARLWGHSLHPMCSYLASFPAALPHAFIARYTRPGDVVLDPFSGRGTAPLQALAEGRIGVGNDLNPLAYALTAAKLDPAAPAEARTRLAALGLAWAAEANAWTALAARVARRPGHPSALVPSAGSGDGADTRSEAVPDEVALAFHSRTLAQLLLLRARVEARVGGIGRRLAVLDGRRRGVGLDDVALLDLLQPHRLGDEVGVPPLGLAPAGHVCRRALAGEPLHGREARIATVGIEQLAGAVLAERGIAS